MKKLNLVFSLLLILVSTCFFFYADTFKTLPNQQDIGPGGFPKAICAALILCALILLVGEARKPGGEKVSLFNAKLLTGLGVTVGYFLALKPLGFVVSSILATAAMMLLLLNEPVKKAWPLITAVSVAAPVALYLMFGMFLKVPLPGGVLEPLLG